MKELQSLGLDVTLEDENGEEVKLLETSEYGNTDLNAIISGDRNFNYEEKESLEQWASQNRNLMKMKNWLM